MDKTLGNYLTQNGRDFPLDCETLQYTQDNDTMLAMLGNLAGDRIILSALARWTEPLGGLRLSPYPRLPRGRNPPLGGWDDRYRTVACGRRCRR